MLRSMKGAAVRGTIKVWLYVAASVAVGAWAAPLVYNTGKALAEVSAQKDINGPVEWLADRCRTMEFPGFFVASVAMSALVLALPFALGLNRPSAAKPLIWDDQRLQWRRAGALDLAVGFGWAAAPVLVLGALYSGFHWRPASLPMFALAVGIALVQEILFRGVALGIFLRTMPDKWAIAVSALLFALVHCLVPMPGVTVADADAAGTGWEMLGEIFAQLVQPRVVLSGFVPMLTLGWVLAAARVRTNALWMPIGLHAGWTFGNSMVTGPAVLPWSAVWLPLAAILLAGWFAGILTKPANDRFVCRF